MKKVERIPDEKIEIVFHQGKRLGPCFGEHTFDFRTESAKGTHREDAVNYWCHSKYSEPPSHSSCRSSSGFYSDAVSKAAERMAEDLNRKIIESLRGVDPNNPLK